MHFYQCLRCHVVAPCLGLALFHVNTKHKVSIEVVVLEHLLISLIVEHESQGVEFFRWGAAWSFLGGEFAIGWMS